FELVDVRFILEQGGWTLRVQVDLPLSEVTDLSEVPSDRVDLEDCENISRELSAVLDVDDPIPHAYSLEFSSPGIDRPLRTAAHFRRFAGAEIKVSLAAPLAGTDRKNFKGELTASADDTITMVVDGQTFTLPIVDIDTARLVPDWDDVMKGGSGVGVHAHKHDKPQK